MKISDLKSKKQIIKAVAAYTAGSILGPLVLFGAIGFYLDHKFDSKPLYLLIGVGVAFIVSNVLAVKKSIKMAEELRDTFGKKNKQENDKITNLDK